MGAILGFSGMLLAVLACVLFTRDDEKDEKRDERERPAPPREVPQLEWFLVMVPPASPEPAKEGKEAKETKERMETLARRVTALEVAVRRMTVENRAMAERLAELRDARGRDSSRAA